LSLLSADWVNDRHPIRDKMLLVSDSDLEINAKQLGKLLSQQQRLEREGTVKEVMGAQKPAFDSTSTTRHRNGGPPDRNESWVYYRYQEAPMYALWREKLPPIVTITIATSNVTVTVYFAIRVNIRQYLDPNETLTQDDFMSCVLSDSKKHADGNNQLI
jgi:hypothetical protein